MKFLNLISVVIAFAMSPAFGEPLSVPEFATGASCSTSDVTEHRISLDVRDYDLQLVNRALDQCGNREYSFEDRKKALDAAVPHLSDGTTATGSNGIRFDKHNCKKSPHPYIEFPILPNRVFKNEDDPDQDRIKFRLNKAGDVYNTCNLITQEGAKMGKFKKCTAV